MGKPKIILDDFAEMLNFDSDAATESAPIPVQGGLQEMDFDQMESFPNHKFKLYEGQRLHDMAESIRQMGILLPLIIWHTDDNRFVILSGHNRRNAAKLAGLTKSPIIIKEHLTMEEAVLIVTETNLHQRSFADMSHSERAYCLAQHYDALKSQGKRNDLLSEIEQLLNPDRITENETLSESQTKSRTDEKVGKDYGLSRDKVAKYIRLAKLIPSILSKVDKNEIGFIAAYEISFIEDREIQQMIVDFLDSDGLKVDTKKAELLREYFERGKLTDTMVLQILSGEKSQKPKSNKPQPVKVKPTVISKYFKSGESQKEIEGIIEQALELFFRIQTAETDQSVDFEEVI